MSIREKFTVPKVTFTINENSLQQCLLPVKIITVETLAGKSLDNKSRLLYCILS